MTTYETDAEGLIYHVLAKPGRTVTTVIGSVFSHRDETGTIRSWRFESHGWLARQDIDEQAVAKAVKEFHRDRRWAFQQAKEDVFADHMATIEF